LRAYAATCVAHGATVGGIASPAVFADGRRAGYDLLDLRTGALRELARIAAPGETATVGPYRFDDDAVQAGNAAISAAIAEGLPVVAVDEVGPLELAGGGWAPALVQVLAECDARTELVLVVRTGLVDALEQRFPSPLWAAARLVEVQE